MRSSESAAGTVAPAASDGDRPPRLGLGVVLPHFGTGVTRELILRAARDAEALGFDSVWVRDHVAFASDRTRPDRDYRFIDPFVTLSLAASVTDRVALGFAALTPHRHPVQTAGLLAALDAIAGPNRIVVGIGIGSDPAEFAALEISGWEGRDVRREAVREQVTVMRSLWAQPVVSHQGDLYRFENISVRPLPGPDSIRIWFCGASPAAVRSAVDYCDGWGPVKLPRRDLEPRIRQLRGLEAQHGTRITTAVSALVSPGPTLRTALRPIDLDSIYREATRRLKPPPSGTFSRLEDLDGFFIAGPPDVIIDEVAQYRAIGAEHFIFDLRERFRDWDRNLVLLGEEVIPSLRTSY